MEKLKYAVLIEDEPIHQFLTKKFLKEAGFFENIKVFSDGKEAFDEMVNLQNNGTHLPEIILLDLNMPVWTGWDFLNAFKNLKIYNQVTIVILTSSQEEEDRLHAAEYGLDNNFLIKPLSKDKALTILKFLE